MMFVRAATAALIVAAAIASSGCWWDSTSSPSVSVKLECNPQTIVTGMTSTLKATVTADNARARGKSITFSAPTCGSLDQTQTITSSGISGNNTLEEGEAEVTFTGSTNTGCTVNTTAVSMNTTSNICAVTVTPKPVTVTAVPVGTPPGTVPAAYTQTVSIVPNVMTPKNPFKATYSITTTPNSAKIFNISVTTQVQANIEHMRTSRSGEPNPAKGVTSASFAELTQLGDDVVTVTTDSGKDGGTITFSVGLVDDQDSTHVVYATFTAALPGPKP